VISGELLHLIQGRAEQAGAAGSRACVRLSCRAPRPIPGAPASPPGPTLPMAATVPPQARNTLLSLSAES